LASTLVLDQEILLFDEPTAGMDPHARDDILKLFKTLQDQGKTIIIASHRMEELAHVADHLSLMQSGVVIHTGVLNSVIANISAIQNAGLMPPLSVQVAQSLVDKGWPLNVKDAVTPDQLFSAIQEVHP
jgi:energy-coupling factor transport system ATP-binding protein